MGTGERCSAGTGADPAVADLANGEMGPPQCWAVGPERLASSEDKELGSQRQTPVGAMIPSEVLPRRWLIAVKRQLAQDRKAADSQTVDSCFKRRLWPSAYP